jgi:hypothetical protein
VDNASHWLVVTVNPVAQNLGKTSGATHTTAISMVIGPRSGVAGCTHPGVELEKARNPEIVGALPGGSCSTTGNFFIDDEVLRAGGVPDLDE